MSHDAVDRLAIVKGDLGEADRRDSSVRLDNESKGKQTLSRRVTGQRRFSDGMVDGIKCGFDGHRVDVAGNVWSGSTSVPGYQGVTVWNPAGKLIGRIRLPETCANVTFCGPKKDWLFMCASQSVYLLRLGIQGAAPG